MKKIGCALFLSIILTGLTFSSLEQPEAINVKLRVKASLANIRSGPSLNNKIIMQAKAGTVLSAVGKEGGWYLVTLSQKGIEPPLSGYIHQSIVEVMIEPESVPKQKKMEPEHPTREEATPPISRPEPKLSAPEKTPSPYQKAVPSNKMHIRASYSMGFLEEALSNSWQETIYHETASASIDYNVQKGNFFSLAFGFRAYGQISVELGVDVTSRNMDGAYSASIPHPLLFEAYRNGEGAESYTLSENSVFLNLVYSFRSRRFGLDLSVGPAYIMAKTKVISGINYTDSYPYDSVTLTSSDVDASQNVFGFNGGAHFLFYLTEKFALDLNAHYLYGKASFESGTDIQGPEITLGGLKAGAGLKILF